MTRGQTGAGAPAAVPPPVDERYSDRVEEILATATRLFSEFGYRGVGIRMIADAVGVQTSTLYHHFSSKEQILYRIAARATTRFIDTYGHLLDAPGEVPDVLKPLIRVHVVYFYENSLAQQLAARELRELEPAHFEEVRRAQRNYLDRVVRLVARGSREGQLVVANPAIATRAFFDMLNNFNRWFAPRPNLGLSALADLYATMIVDDMLGAARVRSAPGRR